MSRKPRPESAYVSIGGGLKFITMDYFLREFAPMGMSTRGFRALCKSLSVPMIRVGRTWLIELFAFQQAMRAISRPGQPDFLAPGCDMKGSRARPEVYSTELDMSYFKREYEAILGEMMAARKVSGLPSPKETEKAARDAAKRMVQHKVNVEAEAKKASVELFKAVTDVG